MASTYSAALRLELMATGDQSGTWGDTTNANLGTLLEQAITGYLSVAQGDVANLTLTTTNGASDQARNAVVKITGALTATRNVVVQTANKYYTIINATTGGFSLVAKTTAGTGISIPPGATMNVFSDGTNVVMGQNYANGQIGGLIYLDAGATVGPVLDLFRDSISPAVNDILGQVIFNGRDSAGNLQEYASIQAVIADPVSTTEDSTLDFYVQVAGTRTLGISLTGANVPFGVVRTQVFTSTGTYTPNANMKYCIIECVGGGGAGGGAAAQATATASGGGGGAGSYARLVASAATIGASKAVTIGAAGTAGSAGNNPGNNGGDTSVGTLCIGKGGTGGGGASLGVSGAGGVGGVAGTGDFTPVGSAGMSSASASVTTLVGITAQGAPGPWGGVAGVSLVSGSAATGGTATSYGAGGNGGASSASASTAAGGPGFKGVVIVIEFCSA